MSNALLLRISQKARRLRGFGAVNDGAADMCLPHTGRYARPDGRMCQQSDLGRSAMPKPWEDMLLAT
jgi:hypothetical protein